ncbi:MAG: hypothetical protein V7609_860 [Verrucomicrobiota bacterium]
MSDPQTGAPIPSATKERKERSLNARKLLLFSSLAFFVLWAVGAWYRSTIHDWDYCVRNNKCFVCHAPAVAAEDTYKGLGKNVRLCSEHSTGPHAWRSIVYGVPAALFIYEDAPRGTGWIFTPLIRWALILMWSGALAVSALLAALSVIQLAFPQKAFYDDYFSPPPKTCGCGKIIEVCEVRCRECAVASDISADWCIFLFAPCLRFRLANLVGVIMGVVLVLVLIETTQWLLLSFFAGKAQTIINALAALCFLLAVLSLVVLVPWYWQDVKEPPIFKITATAAIRNQIVSAGETEEAKLISGSVPLKDVTWVRVSAGRIAQLLKYGDVTLCTKAEPTGALVYEGLDKPYSIKEKVEWLVRQQPLISGLLAT